IGFLYKAAHNPDPLADVLIAFLLLGLGGLSIAGFFTAQPNQGVVLILFGNYVGSMRTSGWWWTNPFITLNKIRLRARSLTGARPGQAQEHAGGRVHRAADAHRGWRGGDGGEGPGPSREEPHGGAGRGAKARQGVEPARRALRGARREARPERRNTVQIGAGC